jgi:hypothetical protein
MTPLCLCFDQQNTYTLMLVCNVNQLHNSHGYVLALLPCCEEDPAGCSIHEALHAVGGLQHKFGLQQHTVNAMSGTIPPPQHHGVLTWTMLRTGAMLFGGYA